MIIKRTVKPKSKAVSISSQPSKGTRKIGELSEAEMKKVSGGNMAFKKVSQAGRG